MIMFRNKYSRYYTNYCVSKGKEYYDYNNYRPIKNYNIDDFQVIKLLGSGKYSVVYKAFDFVNGRYVALKFLYPNKIEKINREILVMNNIKEEMNINDTGIIDYYDQYIESNNDINILSLEYFKGQNLSNFLKDNTKLLPLETIINLFYKIAIAVKELHNIGIFHRDIKPSNILIFSDNIRLIDFGLCEFILPEKEYNYTISSRPFKAPEVLYGNKKYDNKIDSWGLGCVLGCLLINRIYFFNYGNDNIEQLKIISDIYGSKNILKVIKENNISILDKFKQVINDSDYLGTDPLLTKFETTIYSNYKKTLELNKIVLLLKQLLEMDHSKRISAEDAVNFIRNNNLI